MPKQLIKVNSSNRFKQTPNSPYLKNTANGFVWECDGVEMSAPLAMDGDEILVYGEIGPYWDAVSSRHIADVLDGMSGDVRIRINSPGGDVFEGVAIYNQLTSYAGNVHVIIEGLAASAASIIAMSGDTIAIHESATTMIHNPWTFAWGYASELREVADLLDQIASQIVGVYVARTGNDTETVTGWVDAETYMTGEVSVERGFADTLIPNKAAPENSIASRVNMSKRKLALLAMRSHNGCNN
jgi:ATP-dependent protease ClpP protease subunit